MVDSIWLRSAAANVHANTTARSVKVSSRFGILACIVCLLRYIHSLQFDPSKVIRNACISASVDEVDAIFLGNPSSFTQLSDL